MSEGDGKLLLRAGSMAAFAIGIAYLAIIGLYVPIGARPSGAEAWMAHMARHETSWRAILWLSVLTDFLFIPVALSLYLALKEINRQALLLAAACVCLFVVLDLALTWTNYAALLTLSRSYYASVGQQPAISAAAIYPAAIIESRLLFVYNTLTLSLGILLTGWVMRKGEFGKAAAYIGLITGCLGILAVAGSFLTDTTIVTILASTLTTVWLFLIGYRLFRLSR